MEGNTQTGKTAEIDQDQSKIDPANLQSEVDKILNGTTGSDTLENKTTRVRDHKREYQLKKKRRKKKSPGKAGRPRKNPIQETEKTDPAGSDSTKSEYEKYLKQYQESLDPDAVEASGPDSLIKDPSSSVIQDPEKGGEEVAKPRKYAGSLVVLTNFIVPAFCTIATRLISRGKKRPTSKDFRFDDTDMAMLREIADDGAGEEILGNISPGLVYLMVMVAIGFNKVTDFWDRDVFEQKMTEMDKMRQDLHDLTEKYKELESQKASVTLIPE